MHTKLRTLSLQIASAAIMAVVVATAVTCRASVRGNFPQQVTAAPNEPYLLAEEGFMRRLQDAKIDKIAGELEKDPKLIDDPNYLAAHPKLADYIKKHPEAKQKIKEDPKGFFQHLKDQNG